MSNLFKFSSMDEKYKKFLEIKDELIKKLGKKGLLKALEILTPEKLEKIHISFEDRKGLRKEVKIYVDTEEELKLLAEFFPLNPHTSQIKDITFLLFILREIKKALEKDKDGGKIS